MFRVCGIIQPSQEGAGEQLGGLEIRLPDLNNEDKPMSEEQAKKLLAMLSKEERKLLNDLLTSLERMRQPSVTLHELNS